MRIVSAAMALNVAIGIAVWRGSFPPAAKILLTVLLVVKYGLFIASWLYGEDRFRKIGILICSGMNLAVAVYGFIHQSYHLLISSGCLFAALLIWSLAAVFSIRAK